SSDLAEHILLGDAHLEEPVRVRLLEHVCLGRVRQVTIQHDHVGILVPELDQPLAPGVAHGNLRVGHLTSSGSASSRPDFSMSSAVGTCACHMKSPSMKETPLPLTVFATMQVGPSV